MSDRCLLCYVTDRSAFAPDEPTRRRRLLRKIAEAARAGVDYIQLREKDLSARDLESLASEAVRGITQLRTENRELKSALLINSRTDVALAVDADGVHLRSNDLSPQAVRTVWMTCGVHAFVRPPSPQVPLIAVSCHSPAEVTRAADQGVNFAVFGPVFEKKDAPSAHPTGLTLLQEACHASIPVLALGGVTLANAQSCFDAGASGIAAIRLFQENDIASVVTRLRTRT
jgi:thiamine-phosphate pyrophosphorylase